MYLPDLTLLLYLTVYMHSADIMMRSASGMCWAKAKNGPLPTTPPRILQNTTDRCALPSMKPAGVSTT